MLKKTTPTAVIEYFRKLEIEISQEDAALVLEHLTDIALRSLAEYFKSINDEESES